MTQYVPPTYRSIGSQAKGNIDALLAALYRGETTFGQFNIQIEATRLHFRGKADEARAIEQRENDAARRQAALAVLRALPPPSQPRPASTAANTNCQLFGTQMYCPTTTR